MIKSVPNLISYLQEFSQIFPHFIYIGCAEICFQEFLEMENSMASGTHRSATLSPDAAPLLAGLGGATCARRYKAVPAILCEAATILPASRSHLSERRAAIRHHFLYGKSPRRVLPSPSTAPCHLVLMSGCISPPRSPSCSIFVGGRTPLLDIELHQSTTTVPAPSPPLPRLEHKPEVAHRRFKDASTDRSLVSVASRRP
jgi:hypothetical protein